MSQFYGEAVSILKRLERRNGSLKSLVFCSQDKSLRQKKRLYALVYKTLKCEYCLYFIIQRAERADSLGMAGGLG